MLKSIKRKLELECIENAIAKQRGYKYGHGIAFDETNVPEVTELMDPVSDAASATVVAGVGIPGVPPGTPFCNSCQNYGHSRITFCGCKKTNIISPKTPKPQNPKTPLN